MSKIQCDKCGGWFYPEEIFDGTGFGFTQLCTECYNIMAEVEEIPFMDWED